MRDVMLMLRLLLGGVLLRRLWRSPPGETRMLLGGADVFLALFALLGPRLFEEKCFSGRDRLRRERLDQVLERLGADARQTRFLRALLAATPFVVPSQYTARYRELENAARREKGGEEALGLLLELHLALEKYQFIRLETGDPETGVLVAIRLQKGVVEYEEGETSPSILVRRGPYRVRLMLPYAEDWLLAQFRETQKSRPFACGGAVSVYMPLKGQPSAQKIYLESS